VCVCVCVRVCVLVCVRVRVRVRCVCVSVRVQVCVFQGASVSKNEGLRPFRDFWWAKMCYAQESEVML